MATSQSIRASLDALTDHLLELEMFVQACSDLQPEGLEQEGRRWIFPLGRQIDRARVSADELERLLRQQALPLLEDMEKIRQT